jgi:F0F1-type ATP synthase assembly protein I
MAFPPGANRGDLWGQIAFYSSLGFIIPGAVVGGYFLGAYLDEHLHTTPILGIIGGTVGAVSGIIEVLQILTRAEKSADRDSSSNNSGRG